MGLLDDAIREHLELKRLRGADPGEVAREQHEALDPVPRDERRPSEHDFDHGEGLEHEAIEDEPQPVDATYAPDHPAGASELAREVENPDDLRETAELDMRTLLDQEGTPAAHASSATGSMPDAPGAPGDEDSLEWEFPGDSAARTTEGRVDHGHGSGQHDPTGMAGERTVAPARGEDGMERSREPLSEPPEQERLRFEQPPSHRSDLGG